MRVEDWQMFARLLKGVIQDQGTATLMSVLKMISARESALWGLVDEDGNTVGAIVTQIVEHQSGLKVWMIDWAATEDTSITPEVWHEVIKKFEPFAKDAGCDRIRIYGRKGWGRILPEFTEVARVIDKHIGEDD